MSPLPLPGLSPPDRRAAAIRHPPPATRGLLARIEVAGDRLAAPLLRQPRLDFAADGHRERAARVEPAAARHVDRARRIALDRGLRITRPRRQVQLWDRAHQR